MKIFNHLQICNMSLNRIDHTTHGLLMNNLGKDWITNVWARKIKDLFLATSSQPVLSIPW